LVGGAGRKARTTAAGFDAITRSRVEAGPDGLRRPCSYWRKVSTVKPKRRANAAWLRPRKRLVYFERHDDIRTAIQRETSVKRWPRAWKVRLIHRENLNWDDLYDRLSA